MAKCPLCNERAAKRHCPAKAGMICSVCCGTKREIEIDCPSDCRHLQTGRDYEIERHGPRRPFPERRFNEQFFYQHGALITALASALSEERRLLPQLVDEDARNALNALKATMKTLDAGIYYETLPDGGGGAVALYRHLKGVLDELMQPSSPDRESVRVSDVLAVLEFLVAIAEFQSGGRPRSRRYLDWLQRMVPAAGAEQSRLIVP